MPVGKSKLRRTLLLTFSARPTHNCNFPQPANEKPINHSLDSLAKSGVGAVCGSSQHSLGVLTSGHARVLPCRDETKVDRGCQLVGKPNRQLIIRIFVYICMLFIAGFNMNTRLVIVTCPVDIYLRFTPTLKKIRGVLLSLPERTRKGPNCTLKYMYYCHHLLSYSGQSN